jgi:hypothetical protein
VQMTGATWSRACVGAAIALCAQTTAAQSDDFQKGLNQIFKALQGVQQTGAGGAQGAAGSVAAGGVDSASNVDAVVQAARERKRASGTIMGSESWCQAAASPFRPARVQGSGWIELVGKCTAVLEQDVLAEAQAKDAQEHMRAEKERAQQSQAKQEADDYETRRQALLVALKAGKTAPKNCAQWMVGKGLDRHELQAKEVTRLAYRAPQGVGYFDGEIQRIEGENVLVRIRDHLAVIAIDKSSRVFRESELKEQGRIGVVGQQTGTRSLRRTDGSMLNVALVTPACVVGSPDHLLDLMPETGR